MNRLLILLGTVASAAVMIGWCCHTQNPVSEESAIPQADDLDVEAELRTGCRQLIAVACSSDPSAPWAEQELQRAATAPWATPALKAQAQAGLARVAACRQMVAQR